MAVSGDRAMEILLDVTTGKGAEIEAKGGSIDSPPAFP
jgi:hypothetical protein